MLKSLRCLSLLLLTWGVAHAEGLQVRFVAERMPADLGQVTLLAGEKQTTPFDLTVNELTVAKEPPERAFKVHSVSKKADLASVILPEKGSEFIVLLLPSEAGYDSVVIPAKDPSFRPGDVYFFNHTKKTVLGYVGTAKMILAPGKGTSLRPAGAKDDRFYEVGFGVREKTGDRALSRTRWPVDNNMRSYVFFFVNPKTKRIDFRAIDEFVGPAA